MDSANSHRIPACGSRWTSLGWRDKGVQDRLDPLLPFHVEYDEVAVELPVAPAPAALLGISGDEADVA